jgi:hypothetical protein
VLASLYLHGHLLNRTCLHAAFFAYPWCQIPWGAWAAAGTAEDIGSGNVLASSSCYDHAEKGVLFMPFTSSPRSLADPRHTALEPLCNRFMHYVLNRNPLTLLLVIVAAMRSE